MSRLKRSLIITLPPEIMGGVGAKARILADYLRSEGAETTIAYYRPFQIRSELNVSFWQLPPMKKPKLRSERRFGGHDCKAVGCNFPEFEFSYSRCSNLWRNLIKEYDLHFVVGGTVVLANILEDLNMPYIVWCASDVEGDRYERQRVMPLIRKIFDKKLIAPFLLRQQDKVINGKGRILAVSGFTQKILKQKQTNQKKAIGKLPIPTDLSFFIPSEKATKMSRLGFAGRLNDPRKNPSLLFSVLAKVKKDGFTPELFLTGNSSPSLDRQIQNLDISENVFFVGNLKRNELRNFYQSLDLFLIPSFQEGLAIVGIEALACGVPVISTRCGGPEDYVVDGKNGYLVGFCASQMASKVCILLENRQLRANFSKLARSLIEQSHGLSTFRAKITKEIGSNWVSPYTEENS